MTESQEKDEDMQALKERLFVNRPPRELEPDPDRDADRSFARALFATTNEETTR